MAGSQKKKNNSPNSYNRADEDFYAVNVDAVGRNKLAVSILRRTVVASLGLQSHLRREQEQGNTVSSPDTRLSLLG